MLGFVWNLDPVLIHLGPVQIRYYGVVFVCTVLIAYFFWLWQMRRGGFPKAIIEGFITWGVVATITGARLGHCFFYDIWPAWRAGNIMSSPYARNPLRLLAFWEGGLASHGAAIGLIVALLLYSLIHRLSFLELMDRFSPSAAIGAAGIRLGNFLNSEIVGRATNLPWAVRFMRYDNGASARHPSQLYEFAMGLFVLLVVVLADRWAGREKRPRGLLVGVFLLVYFAGRFCVEFVKEYQTRVHSSLTMGQYLSIIPMLIGAVFLLWCIINPVPTRAEGQLAPMAPQPQRQQAKNPNKPARTARSRRNRRKRK